ncbi:unnamed protein product [Gadus morhua 'NCC']
MLSSLLRSALVLAAVYCLTNAESVITCENGMQRLSCDEGVISVLKVAYGRTDRQTCSEGRPPAQLANTACSQKGALEALASSCNGRKVCEVDKRIFGGDPCYGTYKYTQTTYTCLTANHVVACELSTAELICEQEEVIKVIGAFYGRNDRTTCIYGRPNKQIEKVTCSSTTATSTVAKSCDGKRRCTVYALNSKFGDPCYGTFKYLELAYTCGCSH